MFKTIRWPLAIIVTLLIAALLVTLVTTVGWTQEVAIGTATATVLAAVTVAATSSLAFGDAFQGVPKSIANNHANAGVFSISGQADAQITVYFQLPDYLVLASSADRMTISFSATDASVDTTGADNPAGMAGTKGWQNTDPRSLPATMQIGSAGTSIYLGGKVVPSLYQQSGSYSGDIILTVSYNGT